MSGYNPDRIFDLIGSVGINLAYTSKSDHKFQPGVNASIQGLWHVNDFLGLYIEPQIRFYGDKFIEGNLGFMQKDVMVGVNAGFHYRFVPYSKQPIVACLVWMTSVTSFPVHLDWVACL